MDKLERMKELVTELNEHSYKYYVLDKPTISDKEYDLKYSELETLEKETNTVLSNSPTQKVQGQVLPFLTKVPHTEPMLSADKSKDINDIIKFMGNQKCVMSWKLDGLTIVLRYNEGRFQQAVTRGGGTEGEDVTHTVRCFTNIPLTINYKGYLEIRGEGLVPFSEFNRINNELIAKGEETYASARNLAAGSVRQLDAKITRQRKLMFLAFGIVKCDNDEKYKDLQFDFLESLGFSVVEHILVDKNSIKQEIEKYKERISNLPFLTDGLIIEYNDVIYGKKQGVTGHHSKNMIALKHSDDSYETIFRGVELNTTRTGMVSITALFDTVDMDGVSVSRATLHNYDIFESFELGIGDTITTYRANSVVPQVEENLTRSNTYKIDMKCPSCGSNIEIKTPKEARFLFCENPNCNAKLISKLSYAVSKNCLNIDGLSEATLEKFIEKGFLSSVSDIYKLENYKQRISNMVGFGLKSYNNLISSINASKKIKLENFIASLGIEGVGVSTAKLIAKKFKTFDNFININNTEFLNIEGVGDITAKSISAYRLQHMCEIIKLSNNFEFINEDNIPKTEVKENPLKGKKLYCTGTFASYKKEQLKQLVESLGAEFSSGYAKSLDYLAVGSLKGSSKEAKALKDGVKVLTEDQFLEMIK